MIDVKRANVLFIDGKTDKAVEMYYEGALLGDAECAFNYAYCLLRGKGTAKDAAAAKSFFTVLSLFPTASAISRTVILP